VAVGNAAIADSTRWEENVMSSLKLQNRPPSPVLPLPPLEYDVQYMNNLIRLLNFFIKQVDNPGILIGSGLFITNGSEEPTVLVDLNTASGKTEVLIKDLPTSATGLVSGQIWNDSNTLKIVP